MHQAAQRNVSAFNDTFVRRVARDFRRHRLKYLAFVPVLIYLALFHYQPMYGILIAFKNYKPSLGIWESKWVGMRHFESFFRDVYFPRIMRNTFLISLYGIFWGFPAPILLALLLNELRAQRFKRVVQTVTYIPHFISLVVICGMIKQFSVTDGVFNDVRRFLALPRISILQQPSLFRGVYVASGIWQEVGWGSIIYLATLSGIDLHLYEAAQIDGAGRLRQTLHITLPGLLPTIVMLLILRMGSILNVGFEKILLLYNPTTYETGDVISTYVYRRGLIDGNFSYSTAVSLFNALFNVVFLVGANRISKRVTSVGLF